MDPLYFQWERAGLLEPTQAILHDKIQFIKQLLGYYKAFYQPLTEYYLKPIILSLPTITLRDFTAITCSKEIFPIIVPQAAISNMHAALPANVNETPILNLCHGY